jgi:hypothetical protein
MNQRQCGPEMVINFVQSGAEQSRGTKASEQQNQFCCGPVYSCLKHPSTASYLQRQLLGGKNLRFKGWLPENCCFSQ